MSREVRGKSLVDKRRFGWASVVVLFVFSILTVRLWYVQVYRGDYYRKVSEHNRIRKIEIPAPRGIIYDRNGNVVLGNRPFFDLVYIPQFVQDKEITFSIISRLLNIPLNHLNRMQRVNRGRPKFLPIILKQNLTLHEVSIIESNRVLLPGIEINMAPRRDYHGEIPSHMVGYLGEISAEHLKDWNEEDGENLYNMGDLVGKQGLEKRWEPYLRGKRGHRLIQVDAFGRQTNLLDGARTDLPIVPAVPGADLTLTIDKELQHAVHEAFRGKYGAVVVLDPRNGEILAMESSPGFDPTIYQDNLTVEKWNSLLHDPYKPLFDKTTGGEFPPGSVYKPVIAIAGLEEKVISENTTYKCNGAFELGGDVFHCHNRNGHGIVNLKEAMLKSCDVYFYHLGVELGVDVIAKYAQALGMGRKLGVRLNHEASGLVPTSAWKKLTTRVSWTVGDTPPISIGQGTNLMTPVQMASLYSTFANGGKVWRPTLVKKITNHLGNVLLEHEPELIVDSDLIKPATFAKIQSILKSVVMDSDGTGRNAMVEGHTVAGKTGSVQVVSLKKNRNKEDNVSMKWKEHAMFAAFSPVEAPEIALAVVSENDRVGGGGASAAPVAQKIIEAYWKIQATRKQNDDLGKISNSKVLPDRTKN